jgi:type I restriction enzyme, S subunit
MKLESRLVAIGVLEEEGAILEIQDGNHGEKPPKATDYVDNGIPFIMANNIVANTIDIEGAAKLPPALADSLRIGFSKNGDVLLTHKGTIGSTAIVDCDLPYLMLTPQVTYYRTDLTKLINRYLMYAFQEPRFQKTMASLAQQATRPYIGITAQRRLKVRWMPIDKQLRIVAQLAPIDDLIENNRRRIQLLEQSARLLYKEWFAHLRFPGHEHVKITNGVPEGWEKLPLGNLLTLQRGFDLPLSDRKDGPYPVYASTGINGFHETAKVKGPGVVTGRSGSLGSVMYVPRDFWPLNTALWVKEFRRVSPLYALHLLSEMHLEQYNGGAAVPTLNRNDVHRVEQLCPNRQALRLFDEHAAPVYRQIEILEQSNKALQHARNLLLPRLMNGEVAV